MKKKCKYSFCAVIFFVAIVISACATSQSVVDNRDTSGQYVQKNNQTETKTEAAENIAYSKRDANNEARKKSAVSSSANNGDSSQEKLSEEQEMMEKILALLEEADDCWDKGDIDNTINILDKAYAMLLDADGNAEVPRQKDDLRLLISKRILAVYSAQQSITKGKAGEIPIKLNDAIEREIRSFQGPDRDFFISSYQRSGIYKEMIIRELKLAGIPEEFVWLPLVESGFKTNALSRSRALGLWQFIPSTGYKFGLTRDEWIDERMDPVKATHAAIAYLKELHSMFGDWLTVLAAYNCGEGRVLRVISRQKINYFDRFWDLYNYLPRETARYAPRFLATLHIIKDPQKYGFDLPKTMDSSIAFQTVTVNRMMKLKDIAEKIEVSEEIMNVLNAELRHKITPDREYNLKIPADYLEKFNIALSNIPSAEKPSLASKTSIVGHRVKRGETLSTIARRYRVSISDIRNCNNMRKNSVLIAGRTISVPLQGWKKTSSRNITKRSTEMRLNSAGQYKVQKGDALQIIARSFGVSVGQIKELNNLQSDSIYAGQLLKISENKVAQTDNNIPRQSQQTKIKSKVLSADDIEALGTDKYIVTKGDNLYRIALKNNIDVARIKELNNLTDEKIIPGQILIIR
jgi:membrane-bound lytic murein transglycosylase D